jgi:hypothetical protein
MRQIMPYSLWLGHAGEARNLRAVLDSGILAVLDLALEEAPAKMVREIAYFRVPLVDGSGNPPWLLRAAVDVLASLLRSGVPALVSCGAGMSRSPAVAAVAISAVNGQPAGPSLELVAKFGKCDVLPGFWRELLDAQVMTSVT